MSKKHIYLAGPIAGCTHGEANDWRTDVSRRLPEGVVGISPLRCEPLITEKYELVYEDLLFGTAKAISSKNIYDLNTCDMVLAYLPQALEEKRPSIGTLMECGGAVWTGKPLILVTDNNYVRNHPLFAYGANWVLDNFDDAIEVITGLLVDYT